MSARARLRRSAAITLTAAITTGSALLLTACDPSGTGKAAPAPANPASAAPNSTTQAVPAPGSTHTAGASKPPAVNGTAHNGLTISNGTENVVMNGTTVDFHTKVRDLTWNPHGDRCAFINGNGDLVIAFPDGSNQTVIGKNPGGQTWSHPTYQMAPAEPQYNWAARENIIFTVEQGGVSKLERLPVRVANGVPEVISLSGEAGAGSQPLPQTGNIWASGGGENNGTVVYANKDDGNVYIRDENVRQQGRAVTKGSEPAFSPDGQDIVFVRTVGNVTHIFESHGDNRPVRDITAHSSKSFTEPAWSPDGKTIAARTAEGIYTFPLDGSAAPALVSTYTGLPAYRPAS